MTVIKSPLSEENLKVVGDALQGALVDLVDLSLVAKQIHWTIVGPRFRSIHLQLDDVVASARKYTDRVAERASAVGVVPDGRAETVARTSGIDTVRDAWIRDTAAVQALVDALGAMIARMRDRIDATEEPDLVTQDLLIGLTRDLEKHHWMFQAEHVDAH
jgi:starvation-inducible DNA-binding protein